LFHVNYLFRSATTIFAGFVPLGLAGLPTLGWLGKLYPSLSGCLDFSFTS